MNFWKMQGAGNDFVVIDNMAGGLSVGKNEAIRLADRHFGVGADQILIAEKSEKADFFMRIFNNDGSEVEMCGNGIRAIAIFALKTGICIQKTQKIDTLAGIKTVEILKNEMVRVNMGEAKFSGVPDFPDNFIDQKLDSCSTKNFYKGTCVSVGNPHCVVFVDNVDSFPVEKEGRKTEVNPLFPNRINTEFIEKISPTHLKMRVWERGSGETLACGTGATASAVASVKNGFSPENTEITVSLRGGDLKIFWKMPENQIFMSGEAKKVFEGEVDL